MRLRRAFALVTLLAGGSACAADLRSDAETLLRRLAADPEASYVVQSAKPASITEQGDEVTIKIAGLVVAPKINTSVGMNFGDVVIHVRRRADGGIEASTDLPRRLSIKGGTPQAGGKVGVENGRLMLSWGADLENDGFLFSADSLGEIGDDDKPGVTIIKPSMNGSRTGGKASDGRFAFSVEGARDRNGQGPAGVQGFGPFVMEGHYENFPSERYRLLLRHLLQWEQIRAARGNADVGLGGLEQGMALLQEAGLHYAIDKMMVKFGAISLQAEADIHFSLEAAHGVTGSGTAWLVEVKDGTPPDPSNPAVALGTQMAGQFGAPGKAPDGSDAKIFHVELAADGSATLNGQPSPAVATGIVAAFNAFAQGWAGSHGAAAANQTIPGSTGCGVPIYPKESLAANESGVTSLTFDYDAQGKVLMTRIKSSGFSRLDDAARIAYVSCNFPAGTVSAVIPVVWKIENGRGTASIGPGLTTTSK